MRPNEIIEPGLSALEHRRHLARLRHRRENERRALLFKLIKAERRALQLRLWLDGKEGAQTSLELTRMLEWARRLLSEFEAIIDPAAVTAALRDGDIFCEVDDLHDPLGEPPARQPWGR